MFLLLLFLVYRDNSVPVENPVTQVEREEMVVARTNALRKGKCKDLFVAHRCEIKYIVTDNQAM